MEGKEFGDFEIKRIIGQGTLGPVYLAEHKFIKKLFALKFLPDVLFQNDEFKSKFIEDISKIAELNHENLAPVHNVSCFEERLFIVSDYVPYKFPMSMSLDSYLSTRTKRLEEKEVLQILSEVSYALDYIHGKNMLSEPIAHGGIKLGNILLSEEKSGGYKVKLSDTGITPMLGSSFILDNLIKNLTNNSSDEKRREQIQREFIHTMNFLSPEQRFTSVKKISYKSDIYSFGVLAYFLLMGYLPEGYFEMPSSVYKNSSVDWDMIIRATLTQEPTQRPDNLMTLIKNANSMVRLDNVVIKNERPPYSFERSQYKEDHNIQNTSFSNKEDSDEEQGLAYNQIKNNGKFDEKEQQIRDKPSNIQEFERNLVGNLSLTSNVQPMRIQEKQQQTLATVSNNKKMDQDPIWMQKKQAQVRTYKPEKKDIEGIKPILTECIEIKGQEYERGSNTGARDEKPRHKINISTFTIDIHPVTNEQFLRFLMVMEGEKDKSNHDIILLKESRIKRQAGEMTIETGYAKHPVVGVSYYGAISYAKWIGKRLPTEAEWEIAASSGNMKNLFPFGDNIERSEANFFSSDTTPVMSYPPSKNGLFDMVGNVYEWCQDWYDYSYYEESELEPDNPQGPKQGVYRVLRGGCWKSLVDDMRCSHRFRNNPNIMNKTYGFRCVSSTLDL